LAICWEFLCIGINWVTLNGVEVVAQWYSTCLAFLKLWVGSPASKRNEKKKKIKRKKKTDSTHL
jgi:hypothetical protein